jgi:NAD(P)-dependent dehydrogenase (short-subunit alcohol dehydrogenase family)
MVPTRHSCHASAVVTGAGSGIGRAFAQAIAARGGRVVVSDIDASTAAATVELIGGGRAHAVVADVSDLAQVERLATEAEAWLDGPVDLVVNNAGVGAGGAPVGEIPYADWQWTLGINLWGVVHGCHIFVPRLRTLGRGGIVNVCSSASFAAAPNMGPYNVTKAAALALSETLSAELSGTGVHVTALCPTWVKTNIVSGGRIHGASRNLAGRLIDAGMSPARVVRDALEALDANRLYVLPQLDAKLLWHAKRLFPNAYRKSIGLFARHGERLLTGT